MKLVLRTLKCPGVYAAGQAHIVHAIPCHAAAGYKSSAQLTKSAGAPAQEPQHFKAHG